MNLIHKASPARNQSLASFQRCLFLASPASGGKHGVMPKLTPEQQALVEQWAAEGATLNHIQQRLKEHFGLSITYLDARLLMVDLNVKLKEKEKPKEPEPTPEAALPAAPDAAPSVKVTLDELAIPGAMCSGKVTFTDGKTAAWYIDQTGRLGMRGPEAGYRPPEEDVPVFQEELDRVLQSAGF